ncbi:MAG TPA: response regulator transcription factor [Pseudonocardiaceae bacterium]|nr:response regulator transcription factor [Pseudonocardiaceae bacterium]
MIRVLVVDDHEIIRATVGAALAAAEDIDVVASCVDGQDCLDQAVCVQPDVVVMDLSMPRLNGVEATRQLRLLLPMAKVIILTAAGYGIDLRDAMDAGAVGWVFKGSDTAEILRAVRSAAAQPGAQPDAQLS